MLLYKYGLRLRGVSIGTQPKGFLYYETAGKSKTGYWDFVYYEWKLSEDELKKYDMDFIEEIVQ